MIVLKDCSKEYSGSLALNSVSLSLADSGLVLLLGGNAAGKSTLLKSMAGLLLLSEGEATAKFPVSYFGHESGIYQQLSVGENLSLLESFNLVDPALFMENVREFELSPLLKKNVSELSKGQKARVNLARVFSAPKNWPLLLDEPAANLDAKWNKKLQESVAAERTERLVVLVTHDPKAYLEIADRIIFIASGKIVSDQSGRDVDPERLEALYKEHLR